MRNLCKILQGNQDYSKRKNKLITNPEQILNLLPFHQVDERWPIFGCKDYGTYLEKYMVEGLFHEGVSKDVKESYKIVEYLIAHAWYHYPMYDEALNRALRTFELAIKKKCTLLSIPIQKSNNKEKRLVDLIDEICEHESNKRQIVFLNFLRELRNLLMHPSEHHYAGGIMFSKILLTVNTINILFAPESFGVSQDALQAQRQKELSFLTDKALIVNLNDKITVVHSLSLCDVFNNGKDEIIKIHADLVFILNDNIREKKAFPKPLTFEMLNPTITSEQLSGIDVNSGLNISITIAIAETHLEACKNVKEYLYNLSAGPPLNINPYLTNRMTDLGESLQKFRHKHYHSLKI